MKNILKILVLAIAFASCEDDVETKDAIRGFNASATEFPADGQSTVKLSAVLSDDSSADRRSVIFSTSSGTFSNGTKSITVKAEFDNGQMVSKADLKSSTTPEQITVTVKPEFDSPLEEFSLRRIITSTPSVPKTIRLTPSASGIASNHVTEVKLIGILKNDKQKFVSRGYKVRFDQEFSDGTTVNGYFRDMQDTTTDSSRVSTYYSAPLLPIGTLIKIRATVLDNGQPTPIKDSIVLTINL